MPRPARDAESDAIIFQGATITELAVMFGMERRDVTRRIYGVPSVGKRNNETDVYAVKDVAPYLSKLPGDVVSRVLRMNHTDLPPMLKKEFWTGEQQRLKVLQMTGHLWPTTQVLEFAAMAFKNIRQQLQLLQDNVERETAFSEDQRAILKRLVDSTMENARVNLVEEFEAQRPAAEPEETPAPVSPADEAAQIEALFNEL